MSVITAGNRAGTGQLPLRGRSTSIRRERAATRRTATSRPATRSAPVARRGAARLPFVLLIVGLLSAGLVTLLLLNTATASGSFTERALTDRNAELTLQQQELERSVAAMNTPAGLAEAAHRLGMVPGGDPVFLVIKPDGSSKIIGTPAPATAPPAPQPPPPTATQPPANQARQGTGTPVHAAAGPHLPAQNQPRQNRPQQNRPQQDHARQTHQPQHRSGARR